MLFTFVCLRIDKIVNRKTAQLWS